MSLAISAIAEIRPERVNLLADLGGKAQILGIAEQVAVFPEGTSPGALAGVVGEPDTDRAMQSLGRIDRHPYISGIVGIGHRRDLHSTE